MERMIDILPFKYQILEDNRESGRMKVRGVFQREGVKNQNGRIYPSGLFERKINERIFKERMGARGMFGELDHPCFHRSDFRVLTVNGWKEFVDVKVGDLVWSRKNGYAVKSTVESIIDEAYDGPMFHIHGRSIDVGVTPGHRFILEKRPDRNRAQEEVMVRTSEIFDNPGNFAHHAIPKKAKWLIEDGEHVVIPGVEVPRLNSHANDVSQDLILDAKLFSAFMGIYLAEGYCKTGDSVYTVGISQIKGWSRKFIWDEILSRFPSNLQWGEEESGFFLTDARLHAYLQVLGNQYDRYIPDNIKSLSPDCLHELIFWFCIGDGRMVAKDAAHREKIASNGVTLKEAIKDDVRGGNVIAHTRQDLFSVSQRLIRDLHECLVKSGGAGTLSQINPDKDYEFAGHIIKAEDKVPLFQLHISHSDHIWLDPRFINIDLTHHTGRIHCLTVTNGSFYVEIDGKSFWTGNSDGKTSLSRVSHIITGLWVDRDGIVNGEAEILDTPRGKILQELFRSDTRVGISSRGSGTLGKTEPVVQDDYKLETFDFVANPSTFGAFPEAIYESVEFTPEEAQIKLSEVKDYLKTIINEMETDDHLRLVEFSSRLSTYKKELSVIKETEENQGLEDVTTLLLEQIDSLLSIITPKINYGEEVPKGGSAMPNEVDIKESLSNIQQQLAFMNEGNEAAEAMGDKYAAAVAIIEEMKNRYGDLLEVKDYAENYVEAASDLIEGLIQRLNNKRSEIQADMGEDVGTAKELLQALVEKYQHLSRMYAGLEESFEASIALLDAVIERNETADMEDMIDEAVNNHPLGEQIVPLLEGCQTPQEMSEKLRIIDSLTESMGVADTGFDYEPLPSYGGDVEMLNEDTFGEFETGEELHEGAQVARKVTRRLKWR